MVNRIVSLCLLIIVGIYNVAGTNTTVNNGEELQTAVDNAKPGDAIILGPEIFRGTFTIAKNGSANAPITIIPESEKSKVIGSGENGTVCFTIVGSYWVLKSIPISNYDVAITITGTKNLIDSVAISNVTKGVEIRNQENTLNACAINHAHYGIIVGANNTNLTANAISEADYPLLVEENTCCGQIKYNTADGEIELRGSEYAYEGNVFKGSMNVSGCNNSFQDEVDVIPNYASSCENSDLGGNLFV